MGNPETRNIGLLKQVYAPRLKSSISKFHCGHHDLVHSYDIYFSNSNGSFPAMQIFLSAITDKNSTGLD
jgi:hypothetical protein